MLKRWSKEITRFRLVMNKNKKQHPKVINRNE